jgi:hypothetical protein
MGDPGFIGFMAIVGVVAFATSLWFLRRVLEMRHERMMRMSESSPLIDALSKRLDRIENALDATSLEVERISESSRFMAKLLAERGGSAPSQSLGKVPEKVITPH